MPDNHFNDEADGANDCVEMLNATIGGLALLIDTLMGNSADGVETTAEEQQQAWEDGKESARQLVSPLPNPYATDTPGRHLLPQLWRAGWQGVRDGHLN